MRGTASLIAIALCSGTGLLADFSYQQTSKVTGGAMAGMMKFAGAFSKQAREPMQSVVMVKGDRMAHFTGTNSAQIIDLSKETITQVDFQKKTYSVLTFAQFTDALNQMTAKMQGKDAGQMTVKASVKETGQQRVTAGMDTHEVILTIEMEGTDQKTGQKAVVMRMVSDMWVAKKVDGYDEVRDFYRRMAAKLAWSPNMGMMNMAGSQKGMAEMMKEMSKLDGVPVFQVMKMGAAGQPGAEQSGNAQPAPQRPQQQQQAEAEKPSAAGALGKLAGGRLGGFGGFGRKKKQQEDPPAQAQPAAAQSTQPASAPSNSGDASLMEITSEMSGFSSGSVDAAKLEVPAGFKQVESDMLKNAHK